MLFSELPPFLEQHKRRVRTDTPTGFVALQDDAADAKFGRLLGFCHADSFAQNVDPSGFQFANARCEDFHVQCAGENHASRLELG